MIIYMRFGFGRSATISFSGSALCTGALVLRFLICFEIKCIDKSFVELMGSLRLVPQSMAIG